MNIASASFLNILLPLIMGLGGLEIIREWRRLEFRPGIALLV